MSTPLSLRWPSTRVLDGLAITILVAVTGVALATFRDYGLGWDDYTHHEYGDLLLSLYGSGFADKRALSFVNLYMYGGGFDMVASLAAKILPFDTFDTRRLIGALVGIVGLTVTWRLGRRVGGPLGGLIALILLIICPLYYGHMFMNPKDSPFAVAMAVLLLGLVRAFEEYPRPQPATIAIFGLGLGLTIGSRIIGGIASLYVLAAVVLVLAVEVRAKGVRETAGRMSGFILRLMPGLALGYLVMGLVWPWSILEPLNPLRAVEYFSHFFEKPWKEMFDGAAILVPDMPRSYAPTLFALEMPELFLGLTMAGVTLALLAAFRRDQPVSRRAVFMLLAVAAVFPIALTVVTRPAMYNGIRHFVFVTPPLAVLGGFATAWVYGRIKDRRRMVAAATAVLAITVAMPLVEMVRLHPYQYTHFNHLAGGIRSAEERYMLDYWGLAFKQASQELRAKLTARFEYPTKNRRWRIAVCGPHYPASVELGSEFLTTWDTKDADFALMLGEFYCADIKAPVLVEVEREGVVFARVYDIRGRSVTTLFTMPPP